MTKSGKKRMSIDTSVGYCKNKVKDYFLFTGALSIVNLFISVCLIRRRNPIKA